MRKSLGGEVSLKRKYSNEDVNMFKPPMEVKGKSQNKTDKAEN